MPERLPVEVGGGVASREAHGQVEVGDEVLQDVADACLVGRPFVYGLALGGADGVHHVLENLIANFDLTMGLAGRDAAADLDRESLRHESELPP